MLPRVKKYWKHVQFIIFLNTSIEMFSFFYKGGVWKTKLPILNHYSPQISHFKENWKCTEEWGGMLHMHDDACQARVAGFLEFGLRYWKTSPPCQGCLQEPSSLYLFSSWSPIIICYPVSLLRLAGFTV